MASFHEVMPSRRRALRRERAAMRTALARLDAGRCYLCGVTLEDALARLGSTRCHECRTVGAAPLRAGT